MLERVLIVDEDVKVRDFLYEFLSEVGFCALTVPTGSEALERLKKERPALIIIEDIPGEFSGIVLAKKIRAFDKDIKIIMLGEAPDPKALADQIEAAGISAYLSKDFQDSSAIKTIVSVLRQEGMMPPAQESRRGRVLIVDDERDVLELVGHYLGRRGFDTECASSGEECMEKIKKEHYDAVILDITMGGMDGLLTLKRIKDADPCVKVIMATALQNKEVVAQARALGAADYITKPFNLGALESSLLSVMISKKMEKKSP
jgi:DNA-binding response OmpR family regulator